MGCFTTQLLYNYSLKLSSKDNKLGTLTLTCLLSFFVVLSCPKLTVRRHIEFYVGGFICQYL